jgi:hypothetical protein
LLSESQATLAIRSLNLETFRQMPASSDWFR